ncbi:hypothetical protein FACS1894103_5680 [Campylobacterota bacterium]|nr:hypothetical protein FACS1894103_5680 [Campylobacterota bacterium]
MAGQIFVFEDFRPFLRHEIGLMQRMREDQRKITIMFLKHGDQSRVMKVLVESLRTSDVVFTRDDMFFVVMPATDKEGAMHVARLLEEYFKHPVSDVNATWPEDGQDDTELLANFSQYIHGKCNIDITDIVG